MAAGVRNMAVVLGRPSPDGVKMIVVTRSETAPVVTVTTPSFSGTITQTATTNRYTSDGATPKDGLYIATTTVTISGGTPNTKYSYHVAGEGESANGTFWTAPANKTTNYSWILSTCEGMAPNDATDVYKHMKRAVLDAEQAGFPCITRFHIDDLIYVDINTFNDTNTGLLTTGKPEETGLREDYACGWGAYYGLLDQRGKYRKPNMDWIRHNLPLCASGGDHAIEDNHCRGDIQQPQFYSGCNRSAAATIPHLESVAKAEWDAFMGNMNPDPLRSDEWHWGIDIGPIRFVLHDYNLHSQPYDSAAPDPTIPMYGATQLADISAYANNGDMQFKCYLHETGINGPGQPWKDWHSVEFNDWYSAFVLNDKLNGTDGNLFHAYGDWHSPHVIKYDTFWAFGAGYLSDSSPTGQGNDDQYTAMSALGGQYMWDDRTYIQNYDKRFGGFWMFYVYADQTPQKIQAWFVGNRNGKRISPVFEFEAGSANNQWAAVDQKKYSF